tara:strand:+ start:5369 stop:6931 length:1563 start_codon:yes stop_codon:yes gene_type:complete
LEDNTEEICNMMKKLFLILLFPVTLLSQDIDKIFQNKNEIYFSFNYKSKHQLDELSKIISLDHKIEKTRAFAYANKKQFENFLEKNINFELIDKTVFYDNISKNNWDFYPTYNQYVDMMYAFADSFPNICNVYSLGTLNSGREILIVNISDNVGQKENEPSFLYTSSMHGDELTGYVLMLRFIDDLLNSYNVDSRKTNLVNEIDIWINPLANPDGAYAGGNNNVWGATRSNANFVDLNRNYPDPQDGPHPDGNAWQDETLIFMGLADSINFNLGSNLHTGAVVANYPWDTWSQLTADDNWWQHVCNEYADTCQFYGPGNYFSNYNDGIINGYDWYEVDGGRQDYMNYFKQCREFTLELSDDKTPNPANLPVFWDATSPSFYNFMEQSLYGLRGIITDSITGAPIRAKVEVLNHDIDSSHVYSSLPVGNYHRYIYQGNYSFLFSKSGYHSKTINASVLNNNTSFLNVQLVPINSVSINDIKQNKKAIKSVDILGRKNQKNSNNVKIEIDEKGLKTKKIIIN